MRSPVIALIDYDSTHNFAPTCQKSFDWPLVANGKKLKGGLVFIVECSPVLIVFKNINCIKTCLANNFLDKFSKMKAQKQKFWKRKQMVFSLFNSYYLKNTEDHFFLKQKYPTYSNFHFSLNFVFSAFSPYFPIRLSSSIFYLHFTLHFLVRVPFCSFSLPLSLRLSLTSLSLWNATPLMSFSLLFLSPLMLLWFYQ